MVAVVSGSGLGLINTSPATRGNVGNSTQGQTSEQVYVNSSNGNLVIQDVDERLAARGLDLALVRTYNSQGLMNDDNGDNWRLNVHQQIYGLSGSVNSSGSTVRKTNGDGSEVLYTYNGTAYVTTVGDGAHDTLIYSTGTSQWTWTDGSNRNTETYDASGRLINSKDVDDNTVTYGYTGALLTSITDGSGQVTTLVYTGRNLTSVQVTSNGVTQTLTTYGYDSQNRLQTVTVDLTPSITGDSVTYVTTYTYENTSRRVASITQSDGTTIGFTYLLVDGQYRLNTYTDGVGKVTTFNYASVSTTATTGSWGSAPALLETSGTAAGPPTIVSNANGNAIAAWAQGNDIFVSRFTSSINSWTTPAAIDSLGTVAGPPSLAIDALGNGVVAWAQDDGTAVSLYASRYDAATSTWGAATLLETTSLAVANTAGSISVSINAGVVGVAWLQTDGTRNNLYAARYAGGSWSSATLLESSNDEAAQPSISVNAIGDVAVVWRQTNNIYGGGYSGGVWNPAMLLETSATAASEPQIAFDGQGNFISVFVQGNDVMAVRFTQATATLSAPVAIDSRTQPPSALVLSVDAAGNAIAAWAQSNDTSVSCYAARYDAATATWGTATLVETFNAAIAAAPGSVSASINGTFAAVSWLQTDGTRNNVWAARYSGGAWSAMELLESSNQAGDQPRIAVDKFGNVTALWTQSDGTAVSIYGRRYDAGTPAISNYLTTTVVDALSQTTTYTQDAAGFLRSVQSPSVGGSTIRTNFDYDSDGNINLITQDPSGLNRQTTMTYQNGNLTSSQDSFGNRVTRLYNSANQIVTETTYLVPDPDGVAGPGTASSPITKRYVYDNLNHLRYIVSAEGRVVEHRYNSSGYGRVTATLEYQSGLYNVGAMLPTDLLSETQLNTWVSALTSADLQKVQRTDYTYDFRGNLSTETAYGATDSTGTGTSATARVTRYVYDQRGQLIQKVDPRGTSAMTDFLTSYVYDGLGRLTGTTEWIATGGITRTDTILYDAANHRIVTTFSNGLVKTANYNGAGLTTSVVNTGPGAVAMGTTSYAYDANGRLRMVTDPSGAKSYTLYDEAGRKIADIDRAGSITQYVYNRANQVVKTVRYADRLSATALGTLEAAGVPTNVTLASLTATLPTSADPVNDIVGPAGNQITRTVYDSAGRVMYSIDAVGGVTRNFYDGASRLVETRRYYNQVTIASTVDEVLPGAITLANHADDRRTRLFYDNDGKLRGTLDANGFVTEYTYDSAGNLTRQFGYANAANPAQWDSGTLSALLGTISLDDELVTDKDVDTATYFYYDNQGREKGRFTRAKATDSTGYFVETRYDAAGNVSDKIEYRGNLTYDSSFSNMVTAGLAAGTPHTTTYTYDGVNRLKQETSFEGAITFYEYNSIDNVIAKTTAMGTSDERKTQARYDVLGRITQELSGEGTVALATAVGSTAIEDVWDKYGIKYVYDDAGRVKSKTAKAYDPISATSQTNKTVYYYDGAGRLRFTLNARGERFETRYNGLGQVSAEVGYANYIATGTTGFDGGLLNDTLLGQLRVQTSIKDTTTRYTYKLMGQVDVRTTAEGGSTTHSYNHFNELETKVELITPGSRTTTYGYNRLGQLTTVNYDATIGRSDTFAYDPFGRRVSVTNQSGLQLVTEYDRIGRVIATYSNALNDRRTIDYDPFSRVLTTRDAFLNATSYNYIDNLRQTQITTPENIVVTTTHNLQGETSLTVSSSDPEAISTSYTYDDNGQLTATSDGKGTIETRQYDSAGRLIKSTDGAGNATRFTYNAADRILTRIVGFGDVALTTTYEYDGQGRVTSVTEPGNKITTTEYDADGRVSLVSVNPAGLNLRTRYAYNKVGDVVTVTEGFGGANPRVTQYEYDTLGRRTKETVDPGSGTNPATGKLYLNLVTEYKYDATGNLIRKIDARTFSTWYTYDAANRLEYTIDALGGVTRNYYDIEGRIVGTRRYTQTVSLPSGNQASTPSLTTQATDQYTQSVFDMDSREIFSIDANGAVTERTYDDNGNVTRTRGYQFAIPVATYATLTDVRNALNSNGNNTSAAPADNDQVQWTAYDSRGRAEFTVDGTGAVTRFVYDLADRVVSTTQYYVQRAKNAAADLASLISFDASNNGNAKNRVVRNWYDRAGRLVYQLDGEGYLHETTYDDVNRREISKTYAGKPTIPVTALTDHIKNRTNGVSVPTNTSADQTVTKEFDAAGRLSRVTDDIGFETYQYDEVGNKRFFTNKKNQTWEYKYDANRHLLDEISPSVDVTKVSLSSGSITAAAPVNVKLITRMTYDAVGNVTSRQEGIILNGVTEDASESRITSYLYDNVGRQKRTTYPQVGVFNGNTTDNSTMAVQGSLRTEAPSTPLYSEVTYDVFGNAIANRDVAGNYSYKAYDRLGRVKYEVDADNYVTSYTYDAFGNSISMTRYATAMAQMPGTLTTLTPGTNAIIANGTSYTVPQDSNNDRTLNTTYDREGRAKQITQLAVFGYEPDAAPGIAPSTFTASPTTINTYNAFGQVIRVERLIDSNGAGKWANTYFYYDNRGLKTAQIDPEGFLTTYEYADASGDLTKQTEYARKPTGTIDINQVWTIVTTTAASNAGIKDGYDRETVYVYDQLDRVIAEKKISVEYTTVSGTSTAAAIAAEVVTSYAYDAIGNRTSVTLNGATTYTYYDVLGRVIAVAEPSRNRGDGTFVVPLTLMKRDVYGNLVEQIQYVNGTTSNLTNGTTPTAATPSASLDRVTRILYDKQGRMLQTERVFATAANSIIEQASYNERGEVMKQWQNVTNPGDGAAATLVTLYEYDKRGNQKKVIEPQRLGGSPVVARRESNYNAFGEVDKRGLDGTWYEFFTYDKAGRMWRTNADTGVYRVYLHNLAGQATAQIDSPYAGTTDLATIASAQTAAATSGLLLTATLYDKVGRIVEQRDPVFTAPNSIEPFAANASIIVSGTDSYLSWSAPPSSTVQARLFVDGVERTITIVSGTGNEAGYTAGFNVTGWSGTHTYKIEYRRPGDTTIIAQSSGQFTVNTATTTTLGVSTVSIGTVSSVVAAMSGTTVNVSWMADGALTSASFEVLIGGNWLSYGASGSESGGYSTSFTVPVSSTGTYTYRIVDLVNGAIQSIGTGTITFTAPVATTTTGGTSPDAVWQTMPGINVSGTVGAAIAASISAAGVPSSTSTTTESGSTTTTTYTAFWSDSSVSLSFPTLASGSYTIYLFYRTHADAAKGIAAVDTYRAFSSSGGSSAFLSWSDPSNVTVNTGPVWAAGGIDAVNYVQIYNNSGGALVLDSRNSAVTNTTLSWTSPDNTYFGQLQLRFAGSGGSYTTITMQKAIGINLIYVQIPYLSPGTYDYIVQQFQYSGETPVNIVSSSGQFVVGPSSSYLASQLNSPPTYLSGVSASGNYLYWSGSVPGGDGLGVYLYDAYTGAYVTTLSPQTGDGTNYYANFFGVGSGYYRYYIQYSRGGTVYKQGSGYMSITSSPGSWSASASAPTNLGGITGFADLANNNFGWSTGPNSTNDTITFRWKPAGAGNWSGGGTLPLVGNYYVSLASLSGTIDFEVSYTAFGAQTPYRVGTGRVVINRATNTTGSATDTSVPDLPGTAAAPSIKQWLDAWGNAIEVKDKANEVTKYRYNQFGQLIEKKDPSVSIVSVTPNSATTAIVSGPTPGNPTSSNYYDQFGRLIATRDGNGNLNKTAYNAANQLTSETHADGGIRTFVYNAFGEQVEVADTDPVYGTFRTRNAYDQGGRLTDVAQELTNGALTGSATGDASALPLFNASANVIRKTYGYDQAGRRISETTGELLAWDSNAAETVRYWYDLHGNIIRYKSALDGQTTLTYDLRGKQTSITDNAGVSQSWAYDYFGHLTGHTDLGGTTYSYTYDQNRTWLLTSQTSSGGQNGGQNKVYTYDSVNHLTQVNDTGTGVGRLTQYWYDTAGRVARVKTTINTLVHEDTRTTYDALGRISHLSGVGYNIDYAYDAAGNRTHITGTYSPVAGTVNTQNLWYSYDSMNRVLISQGVNNAGTVSIDTDPSGGDNYTQGTLLTYDTRGLRTSARTYGAFMSVSGATYSMGAGPATEKYTYDGIGRLKTTTLSDESGTTFTLVDSRNYDKASRVSDQTTWSVEGSALVSRQQVNTYNDDGLSIGQVNKKNGVNESSVDYGGESGYDAAGNVIAYTVTVYMPNGSSWAYKSANTFTYRRGESYQQESHDVANTSYGATAPGNGHTNNYYNANGELIKFEDTIDNNKNRHFANNIQGNALTVVKGANINVTNAFRSALMSENSFFSTTNAARFFFTNEGKFAGSLSGMDGSTKVNFDVNYTPVSDQFPASTPSSYEVQYGDTLRLIALRVYGDDKLWYVIAQANGLSEPDTVLPQGLTLTIPSNVFSVSNDANTFKPFSVGEALGDTTPTQPLPPPPRQKKGCGVLGMIIVIIVAIIVTIYTAGAAAGAMGGAVSGAAGGTAATAATTFSTGLAVMGGGAGLTGISAAGIVASAAIGGAVGSIVSQGVGMALGVQDKFSWSGVALSAIGSAVTAGLGAAASGSVALTAFREANPILFTSLNAAAGSALTQGVAVATGLQSKFSWREVAISAVAAPIADAVGGEVGGMFSKASSQVSNFATRFASGVTGALVRSAFGGKVDMTTVLADAFGNALGNSIVDGLQLTPAQKLLMARRSEIETNNPGGLNLFDRMVASGQWSPDQAAMYASNVNLTSGLNAMEGIDARIGDFLDAEVSLEEILRAPLQGDGSSGSDPFTVDQPNGSTVKVNPSGSLGITALQGAGKFAAGIDELQQKTHFNEVMMVAQFAMGPLAATRALLGGLATNALVGEYVERAENAGATFVTSVAHKTSYDAADKILTTTTDEANTLDPAKLPKFMQLQSSVAETQAGAKFVVGTVGAIALGIAARKARGAMTKPDDLFDGKVIKGPWVTHTKGDNDGKLGEAVGFQTLEERSGMTFAPLQNKSMHGADGVSIDTDKGVIYVAEVKSSKDGLANAKVAEGDPATKLRDWVSRSTTPARGWRTQDPSNKILAKQLQTAIDKGYHIKGIQVQVGVPKPGTDGYPDILISRWGK